MDLQRMRKVGSPTASLIELPEYIINSFIPGAQPLLAKYPTLFRSLGLVLAFWYLGPIARLQALWRQISSLIVATVHISSDEDLFGYMSTYLIGRKTLKADQTLHAISNPPQESRRMPRMDQHEESNRQTKQDSKIKYDQGKGMQFLVHQRRLFWVSRADGDGHQYIGNRYKRAEVLSISCLGRSPAPIKELLEEVFRSHKDKEKTLTIIRRPYAGGYASRLSWSRLTSKPRRALDTVVLEAAQKDQIIADVEEYMDEGTSAFYGSHGIPYRRGYLFYGPPGTGKTSLALALASKFDLDVYVLTLLDQDIGDSDLISLLNQLPGRSLLLLEDIDTAGLSNRKSKTGTSRLTRARQRGPRGLAPPTSKTEQKDKGAVDSDEEDNNTGVTSRVSLSALLNAIDGVAAPEGHVLILTTNKPYELDDALVRAGRISVRVPFTYTTKAQAEEIFRRMYDDIPPSSTSSSSEIPTKLEKTQSQDAVSISVLAKKFAEALPELEYSPADLQDYLLMLKKTPVKAVEGLGEWMKKQQEEKARKEEEKDAEREAKIAKKRKSEDEWKESIKEIVKESKMAEKEQRSGKVEDDGKVEKVLGSEIIAESEKVRESEKVEKSDKAEVDGAKIEGD